MSRQAVLAVSLALALSGSLWGQHRARGGGSSGGGGSSAPAASPAPSVSSGSVSSGGGAVYMPRMRGGSDYSVPELQPTPYSFSGQVDMPDGSNPPEPPTIQRVCGSRVDTVAYCDRRGRFDFSFSGLKTAVLRHVRARQSALGQAELPAGEVRDLAASFQRRVVDTLVERTFTAARWYGARAVGIAGGVSANAGLRREAAARG